MNINRRTIKETPGYRVIESSLNAYSQHPHIHLIDMPFRMTSTWQERGCKFGIWEEKTDVLAWAVYQPAWQNIDYAIHSSESDSTLEKDVLAWGKEQVETYAKATGETTFGYVEFFEDTPNFDLTLNYLREIGFDKVEESTFRYKLDLQRSHPRYQLPDGFIIRPARGRQEIQSYVHLVNTVFSPSWMTKSWRRLILDHPNYLRELDLVVENSETELVGFCSSWLWHNIGQIEPLGIHPNYRGLGLGRALELAIFDAMQRRGVQFLYIDHGSTNEKAIGLSRKNSFCKYKTILRYAIKC